MCCIITQCVMDSVVDDEAASAAESVVTCRAKKFN